MLVILIDFRSDNWRERAFVATLNKFDDLNDLNDMGI